MSAPLASFFSVFRRLNDLHLSRLSDPRGRRGRTLPWMGLLNSLVLGLLSNSPNVRAVESLTATLPTSVRRQTQIPGRISDTTLGATLRQLDPEHLRLCLHAQVKAEARRGNLPRQGLPFGVVAIDGKNLSCLDRWDHDAVQKICSKTRAPYGLVRVHNACLVSAPSAPIIDVVAIPGDTNEIGAMAATVTALHDAYGHTGLIGLVMADGGNSSAAVSRQIDALTWGYSLRLTDMQGGIHADAHVALNKAAPQYTWSERQRGQKVTYRLFRVDVADSSAYGWGHLRQLLRLQRQVGDHVGHRDWATNVPTKTITAAQWGHVLRDYWKVENNAHHTLDTIWSEDRKRTPWTKNPQGVLALAVLRRIELNLIGFIRIKEKNAGWAEAKPPWQEVIEAVKAVIRYAVRSMEVAFSS